MIIEDLLPHGAENALSTGQLLSLTGIKNSRSLQQVIERERRAGALILSSTRGGYYKPDSGTKGINETKEFIRTLHARAINTLVTLNSAKNSLKQNPEQLRMDGAK